MRVKFFIRLLILCMLCTTSLSGYARPFLQNGYCPEEVVNISVYEKINPAIVSVNCELNDGVSTGSGCIVRKDGVVLTSSHVIEGADNIEITTSSGKIYPAKILSIVSEDKDLALLKFDAEEELSVVSLGNSENVKTGQKVLAIGNPFGFNGTLTTGIVSRIDYKRNKIQTDAAINPGSSGGPLVNASGEVIGISQSIYNPDNNKSNIGIGFAVPINEAKKFIKLSKISAN